MLKQVISYLLVFISFIGQPQETIAQTFNRNYGGLGIRCQIDKVTGYLIIIDIQPEMPSERMQLRPNDLITKINNQSTFNISSDDISNLLGGPIGSQCSITVRRKDIDYDLEFLRADLNPIWEPGKVYEYYHIKASPQQNYWIPFPGYEFVNPGVNGSLMTYWKPGIFHPDYPHIIASDTEGFWNAEPGYLFLNPGRAGDLRTVWTPGIVNSTYPKIISAEKEGNWVPTAGYTFIDWRVSPDVQWTPGIMYNNLKIASGETEGTWIAFPGYVFQNPNNSLAVVWKAGLRNPNDPSQISGQMENTWVTKNNSTTNSNSSTNNNASSAVVELGAGLFVQYLAGKNMISDFLYEQAIKDGYHAIVH